MFNFFAPLFFLIFFLTSCGYHLGRGELLSQYSTIYVPYVEGDYQGILTTEVIRVFATQGAINYRSSNAELALKICLLGPSDTNIGFIYAPADSGDDQVTNIVVSNESRLTLTANVSLIDCRLGVPIFGPIEISSSLDYDFEPDLSNINFHSFSLGQIEMHHLARDAALTSLYRILAEKIVDYTKNYW